MFSQISRRSLFAAGGAVASLMLPAEAKADTRSSTESVAQNTATVKLDLPRAGDFSTSPLIGVYDPIPEDQTNRSEYFGLPLDAAWPYGGLETVSGKRYLLLRKITQQTTNYLVIQVDGPKSVLIDPRSQLAQSGGWVRPRMENGDLIYEGKTSPSPGSPGFNLRIGHNDFSWTENHILSISGKRFAQGLHMFVPWRENDGAGPAGGCYYTSGCWAAEGTIFGEPAKGFFILDHDYLPTGIAWNDNSDLIWSKLQGVWVVFATEWDDGTIEWGQFSKGFGDFQFGVASSNKADLPLTSRQVDVDIDFTSEGWAKRIQYTFNGSEKWEFVTAPNGDFVEASAMFDEQTGTNWHGHSGIMRRVGETRKPIRHIAWQEVFPTRMGWKG